MRKTLIVTITALLSCIICFQASAQSPETDIPFKVIPGGNPLSFLETFTGNDYHKLNSNQQRTEEEMQVLMFYSGLLLAGITAAGQLEFGDIRIACYPKGGNMSQLRDVVEKHLEDTPEDRHKTMKELLILSLNKAFSCR